MAAATEVEITPPDSLVKYEAPIFAGMEPSKEGTSSIKLKEGSTKVQPHPVPERVDIRYLPLEKSLTRFLSLPLNPLCPSLTLLVGRNGYGHAAAA